MSTITATPTIAIPAAETTHRHPVRRATVRSGALAAAATTAVAAVADAAGVPFAIDGESIPLLGFAQMTLIGAVLGGVLAAALNRFATRPRRWFTRVTVALTVLSCVPSVTWLPDNASRLVLVATHVIAAAIIVPAIARQTRP